MKKIYIFAVALIATQFVYAQDANDTLTFESMTLGAESFYEGADLAGEIVFGNLILSNTYSGYWSQGFAVSNKTDVTTAGYTNSHSSFSGSGSNSTNFGVFYGSGTIDFAQQRTVTSIDVTNNTYAGLSMTNGDSFGKKFGSIYAADGITEDGTDGEDYFLLQIIPLDLTNNASGDTVSFYLADFRFPDDNDDYIMNDWSTIDLTATPMIANKIQFALSSSDNHPIYGMNTPAYFALDNFVSHGTAGIAENKIDWSISPNPTTGIIQIKSAQKGNISIMDNTGKTVISIVSSEVNALDLSQLPSGIYFAKIQTANGSNTQKVVKF